MQQTFRRLVVAAGLAVLGAGVVRATTIVLVRGSDVVVLAADSQTRDANRNVRRLNDCKIHQFGDIAVAVTGWAVADDDQPPGTHILSWFKESLRGGGPLLEVIERFERIGVSRFSEYLVTLKRDWPEIHRRVLIEQPWFEFVAIGRNEGRPVAYMRRFHAKDTTASVPMTENYDGPVEPEHQQFNFYGVKDGIADALGVGQWKPPSDARSETVARSARELVEIVKATSPKVGGDVDVIVISKESVSWFARKPNCAEAKE